MKQALIMQGIPGSGKSTYLEGRKFEKRIICSANDFFTHATGLQDAHNQCLQKYIELVRNGEPMVVCDNVNATHWQLSPYVFSALAYGYEITVIRMLCYPSKAYAQNRHNVPEHVVQEAYRKFQNPPKNWPIDYYEIETL